MKHLLEKDRSKRIGAVSFESFTSDPFFRPINFDHLLLKQIPPIFIPSSDKTNFDATYDLEELLLEEAPLEARARRQKPRAELKDDATDKEIRTDELHRMIETLFEPFDYTTIRYVYLSARSCLGGSMELDLTLTSSFLSSNSNGTAVAALEARKGDWPHSNTQASKSSNEDNKSMRRNPASGPASPSAVIKPSTSQSNHSDYFSTHEPHNRGNHPPMPNSKQAQQRPGETGSRGSREHSPSRLAHTSGTQARAEPTGNLPVGGTRHLSQKPSGSAGTGTGTSTGGRQVILDGRGSWSHVADKSSTLPSEGLTGPHVAKAQQEVGGSGSSSHLKPPHGVLGFLSRKKGREKSPKPQESGILGKEGARVVVHQGK